MHSVLLPFLVAFGVASTSTMARAELPSVAAPCNDLRKLLSNSTELGKRTPKAAATKGTLALQGLDVDRDGKADNLTMGCPAAFKASGECILHVELSSGGAYAIQEQSLSVISYQGSVYAISGQSGPDRKQGSAKALRLGRTVTSACSGL